MTIYAGRVTVEGEGAFDLAFLELRVAPYDVIAFSIEGEDHGGPFEGPADIRAVFAETLRQYVAYSFPLRCTRTVPPATIRFTKVVTTSEDCRVEGRWEQDGYADSPWSFFGVLLAK